MPQISDILYQFKTKWGFYRDKENNFVKEDISAKRILLV